MKPATLQTIINLSPISAFWICCLQATFLSAPWFQQDSSMGSHERGRAGAVLSWSVTTLAGSCPWSKGHLAPGTEPQPRDCFERCARARQEQENNGELKSIKARFLFFLLFQVMSGALLLLDCLYLVGSRGGCGTRTLWPPGRVSVSAFHTISLQLAWLQNQHSLFSLSVCFHWLQSAFFTVPSFSGLPVSTSKHQ